VKEEKKIERIFSDINKAFEFQSYLEKEDFKTKCIELKGRDIRPYLWIIKGVKYSVA